MPAVLVPIITSIGAAIGGTVGAFLIMESAFVASALIGVALLGFAANSASKAKAAARAAYNAAQVDRLANMATTTGPRELVLGRVRKGGVVVFRESAGYQRSIFVAAIAIAAHEIDAVEQIWLNDQAVELDEDGWVQDEPYYITRRRTVSATADVTTGVLTLEAAPLDGSVQAVSGNGSDGVWVIVSWSLDGLTLTTTPGATVNYDVDDSVSKCRVWWALGTAEQEADPRLMELFPGVWTSDHRGRGVATLFMECRYNETAFPSGLPRLTATIRGAKVYDPRTGLTAWSENPALLMRHVYQHPQFGRATVTAAEDVRITAAANACDTSTVYTVDGVAQSAVALYRASTVVPFGSNGMDALDDLAQAMGGSVAYARGELHLRAGVYTAPVMDLVEADLAVVQTQAGGEVQHRPVQVGVHRERAQKLNTINARIWDAAQGYKESALPPLAPAALVARDGATLAQEVQYTAVGYAPQALHVAGITLRDARDPLTVQAPFKLRTLQLEMFDTVTLTLARYGWVDKEFIVLGSERRPEGDVMLSLKETSEAITELDADFVVGGVADNTALSNPWDVPTPGPLDVAEALVLQGDGVVVTSLTVTWPALSNQAVLDGGAVELEWLRVGATDEWERMTLRGDATVATLQAVLDGQVYRFRARARTAVAVGDWSEPATYQPVGKIAAPGDVAWLLIAGDVLTWAPVTDLDLAGYRLRAIGGSAANWASAAALHEGLVTETRHRLITPLPGLVTYMVKAVDTTGNESAATASVTTVGTVALAGNTLESWPQAPSFTGTITGGAVSGGVLEATATSDVFWGGDAAPHFGDDADLYWPAATYGALVYQFSVGATSAGRMVIDGQIEGSAYTVEMRRTPAGGAFWGDDADPFWGADADAFWPTQANSWEAWPGYLDVASGEAVEFRVTVAAGATRGRIVVLTPYLDVPTVEEFFDDVAISIGGTRLSLTKTFRVITNVQLTPQSDGGTAIAARTVDKSVSLGPLVEMLDAAGADVGGTVDARVKGY